jgi:hypothetical protein
MFYWAVLYAGVVIGAFCMMWIYKLDRMARDGRFWFETESYEFGIRPIRKVTVVNAPEKPEIAPVCDFCHGEPLTLAGTKSPMKCPKCGPIKKNA